MNDGYPFEDDPQAERVVDILKRELPGFESYFDAGTDTFRVHGVLKFGGVAAREMLFAVPNDERAADALAAEFVRKTREHVADAVGLQKLIDEERMSALKQGRDEGYVTGRASGIAEGRRQMLAEVLAARGDEDE